MTVEGTRTFRGIVLAPEFEEFHGTVHQHKAPYMDLQRLKEYSPLVENENPCREIPMVERVRLEWNQGFKYRQRQHRKTGNWHGYQLGFWLPAGSSNMDDPILTHLIAAAFDKPVGEAITLMLHGREWV